MDARARNVLIWILRLGAAGLFLYAAVLKVLDPREFLTAIESFRLFPYPVALAGVYLVPWLEITAAVALLTPALRAGGVLTLLVLMLFFTGIIMVSLARGLDITCGCFGATNETNYPLKILQNSGIILLLGSIALFDLSPKARHETP